MDSLDNEDYVYKINFLDDEEEDYNCCVEEPLSLSNWECQNTFLYELKQFCYFQQNKLSVLHLNINSLHSKISHYLWEIYYPKTK